MYRILGACALAATALLAGCSTTLLVDSDVQAFSTIASVPAGAAYRFERLPSQQQLPVQQGQLEAIAQQALKRVGLRHDEGKAQYSVQVGLQAQRRVEVDPFSYRYGAWGPWGPWGPGFGPGWRRGYYGYGPWGYPDRVIYDQRIGLVMRELSTGRIVYETHAAHDSLLPADSRVLAVMLDSALYGFPAAPAGVRRVNVEIPRVAPAPAAAAPASVLPAEPSIR